MGKKVLITGGLGYVGSHVSVAFAKSGYNIIIADNTSSSSLTNLADIEELVGKGVRFHECDLTKKHQIEEIFESHPDLGGVIHCAHIRPLGEKKEDAFLYYNNNVIGTINLLENIYKYGVKRFVNTSTSNLYNSEKISPPYTENDECSTKDTYTTTNLVIEEILKNIANRYGIISASLRITKTVGAHNSGILGRRLTLMKNDIVNYLYAVASKKFQTFDIKGSYNTKDGTFESDYIHVSDVANAYLKAYNYVTEKEKEFSLIEDIENNKDYSCYEVFNIGSGKLSTIIDLIEMTEQVTGKSISYKFEEKKLGNLILNSVITDKAKKKLKWACKKTLYNAIQDGRKYVKTHF